MQIQTMGKICKFDFYKLKKAILRCFFENENYLVNGKSKM